MSQNYPEWIWHNGSIKPWAEATTHVMSHALHYGSSVFEGIRAYKTPNGAKIFRLTDHLKRLYASAKIYEMVIPYDLATLTNACREVIAKNGFEACYLRPVAYRGLGGFGLSAETPIDVAVATWEMGPYLGAGVNYTKFVRIKSTLADDVKMSDSTGWAVQGGIDYALNKEWSLFASVAALKVKSKVVASGATVLQTSIEFRPIVYSLGVAYHF